MPAQRFSTQDPSMHIETGRSIRRLENQVGALQNHIDQVNSRVETLGKHAALKIQSDQAKQAKQGVTDKRDLTGNSAYLLSQVATPVPLAHDSIGVPGQTAYDIDYWYWCYAVNSWARIGSGGYSNTF